MTDRRGPMSKLTAEERAERRYEMQAQIEERLHDNTHRKQAVSGCWLCEYDGTYSRFD